jgi:hypothetical protein
MVMGGITWAPFNLSNALPTVPIAWAFGSYVKNRFLPWWSKYTYVLAAALTAGVALSAIDQFAALEYHPVTDSGLWMIKLGNIYQIHLQISWRGNNRPYSTCD